MEKIVIRQPEYKALLGLLKLARKEKDRVLLHHLLVENGAIHVTNGRMIIRLNKGVGLEPEPLKLSDGIYEILKADTTGKHSPAFLCVEKIEGTPPTMDVLINASAADFKPFNLYLERNAESLSTAVVKLYRAFKQAFNYQFLEILTPLEYALQVFLLQNGKITTLKLDSDAVTALIMPFTLAE